MKRNMTTVVVCLVVGSTACRVGPPYTPPKPPAAAASNYKESPVQFKEADGWQVASPQDAMLKGNWWEIFGDAELDALETKLNIDNQNIRQFFENFMVARAEVAEARAQFWPTVTFNPSMVATRPSKNGGSSGTVTGGSTGTSNSSTAATSTQRVVTNYSLPIDASWEPDLWGKIRNEVRAAEYGAQVSAADLENEKLTEQASLAEFFFELRGQDQLKQILDQTVAADRQALQLAQSRYQTGVDTELSVVQAQTTLDSAIAQDTALGVERAQYEHAIAMLTGGVASDFSMPARAAVYTPPQIPTGVPGQLVERRPDVAAAERTMAQANATIGVGYGAFFPQVTISADAGFQSSILRKLIEFPSLFWSVGPSASQVLFNGGLYRAELEQYTAAYNADVAAYRQSVLVAFQQVEDALGDVRIDSDQIRDQQTAVASAQRFLDLELARYRTGIDPYLNVLTAQNTLLSDQLTLATVQVQRMVAAVQLVQALGGGWDRSKLPGPADTTAKPAAGDYKTDH